MLVISYIRNMFYLLFLVVRDIASSSSFLFGFFFKLVCLGVFLLAKSIRMVDGVELSYLSGQGQQFERKKKPHHDMIF